MKVSRMTLQWAGLKVQNESKNLAIVHGRVRDDAEKKMRIKKNDNKNEDQHHKNLRTFSHASTTAGSF